MADAFRRRWWVLIFCLICGVIVTLVLTLRPVSNTYSSSATVYISSVTAYGDLIQGRNMLRDYSSIITSNKVSERASTLLGGAISPNAIRGMLSVGVESGSTIVTITTTSTQPELCPLVANNVADAFLFELEHITLGIDTISVKVLDYASGYALATDGSLQRNTLRLVCIAISAIVGVLIILFSEFWVPRIRTYEDMEATAEIEVLGVIPWQTI